MNLSSKKHWASTVFTIYDISNRHKVLFSWCDIPYAGNYHMYVGHEMGSYSYLGVRRVLGINYYDLDRDRSITTKGGLHCPSSWRGNTLGCLVFAKVTHMDLMYVVWDELDEMFEKIKKRIKLKIYGSYFYGKYYRIKCYIIYNWLNYKIKVSDDELTHSWVKMGKDIL